MLEGDLQAYRHHAAEGNQINRRREARGWLLRAFALGPNGLEDPRTGAKASGKGKMPANDRWEDRA